MSNLGQQQGVTIPSHRAGIGAGDSKSVIIPKQFGPISEWINKHIRSLHAHGPFGAGALFPPDYLVATEWATEVAAGRGIEGQIVYTYQGYPVTLYSTIGGAVAAWKASEADKSIWIAGGTYQEDVVVQCANDGQTLHRITIDTLAGATVVIDGDFTVDGQFGNSATGEWRPVSVIRNLKVKTSASNGDLIFGQNSVAGANNIIGLAFENCTFEGKIKPISKISTNGVEIERCTFTNCNFGGLDDNDRILQLDQCYFTDCAFNGPVEMIESQGQASTGSIGSADTDLPCIFKGVVFRAGVRVGNIEAAIFDACTFDSVAGDDFAIWISGGDATRGPDVEKAIFTGCTFHYTAGTDAEWGYIKLGNASYGSRRWNNLVISNCTFDVPNDPTGTNPIHAVWWMGNTGGDLPKMVFANNALIEDSDGNRLEDITSSPASTTVKGTFRDSVFGPCEPPNFDVELGAGSTNNIYIGTGNVTGDGSTGVDLVQVPGNIAQILNEPTGFPNRADSVLSFVSGTRTFTIGPSNGSFDYYQVGVKYTVSAPDDIIISDVSGAHFLHYDGATLTDSVNPGADAFDVLMVDKVLVGLVYWNATDGAAYILGDERHGTIMSGKTHEWLHDTIGAVWNGGLTVSGYTEDEPDNDASLTLYLTDGEFYDQDIDHNIVDGSPANQYEQQLDGVADAEIPVIYRDDVDGSWKEDAASTLPYKVGGTGRLAYNKDDGDGTFSQVEVTDNKFVSATLIATSDWQYPIKMVQGQAEYTDKKTAIEEATNEIIAWGTLPSPELVVLYRFVMQTKDSYGSTPNAQIVDVTDFRRSSLTGGAATAQDHGTLSGLGDDDHAQYTRKDTLTTKGDIYAASAGSTPARLAVGANSTLLGAASGETTGLKYITRAGTAELAAVAAAEGAGSDEKVVFGDHVHALGIGTTRGDLLAWNSTPVAARLALSVPAANVRNVLGVDNGESDPSWKTALDATNPANIANSASPGTALPFAHRDHVHAHPAGLTATLHHTKYTNAEAVSAVEASPTLNLEDVEHLIVNFTDPTTLTLDTDGEITVTQSWHKIDTFEAAATDDLDTINGGDVGDTLIIETVHGARNVVVKHGTGNLSLAGGADVTLDVALADMLVLMQTSAGNWVELSRNVQAGKQTILLLANGGLVPRATTSCGDAATAETTNNKINYTYLPFDKDADEYACTDKGIAMPDNWDTATLTAQFYWATGSGGGGAAETVRWAIQILVLSNEGPLDSAFGSAVLTDDTWIDDEEVHISSVSGAITPGAEPGSAASGDLMFVQVYRDVSGDDLGGDARLLAVKLEYGISALSA